MMTDVPQDGAHRTSEVARLTQLLEQREKGLRICGISGPGGVGKSYLWTYVESAVDVLSLGWLKLSIDGSNEQSREDFFGLLDGQLGRQSLSPPARPENDYFPHLRKLAAIHRALVEAVTAELSAESGGPVSDAVKGAAIALLKAGRRLNKTMPLTVRYFDIERTLIKDGDVGRSVDEAWQAVQKLGALRDGPALPGPLRDALGITTRTRVRTDLYNVTADALITDLSAALAGHGRIAQRAIPGLDRLLLVIDDFEALAPTLEDFLVGALIPRLAAAPFPTLLVILCRDDLEAMHPAWGQHCRKYLRDQVRLSPFNRETALELLARASVPEERRGEIYEMTQGFPFLLDLLIEGLSEEGAGSALFLRKFFDRTTRWMSAVEREWFVRVCYLDAVNLDALRPLFPGEDVEKIQSWFEREASIRDPLAPVFRVRPLIREKVLRYHELRAPSRHRELSELARAEAVAVPREGG